MRNKSGDPRELALDSLLEDLAYRPRDDGLSSFCLTIALSGTSRLPRERKSERLAAAQRERHEDHPKQERRALQNHVDAEEREHEWQANDKRDRLHRVLGCVLGSRDLGDETVADRFECSDLPGPPWTIASALKVGDRLVHGFEYDSCTLQGRIGRFRSVRHYACSAWRGSSFCASSPPTPILVTTT